MTELEAIKERALDDAAAQAFRRYAVKMEAENLDLLCALRQTLAVEVVGGRIVVATADGRSAEGVMEELKADPQYADRIGSNVAAPKSEPKTTEIAPAVSAEERRLRKELEIVTDPERRRGIALRLRDIDVAKNTPRPAPFEFPPDLKDATPEKRLAHYRAAQAAQKE